MKKRPVWVWAVALVTLGSGLVNLYSVIRPSLPERHRLLREVFPLEFLHLSRSVTLLIGFALIISSLNVFKRKKRAVQIVFLLSCAAVVFHLVKGLDYEEALLSLVLLIILLLTRKSFTVKSSIPDFRSGLLRLGIAALVGLGYGVAGFWLLDPRQFGINFTLVDSIRRTLLFFSLVGDPQIVPHTFYARWFVDSLYLMATTAFLYAGFSLFRPVIYQYRTLSHERDLAGRIVAKHGRSSLDYFKLWPDKSYVISPSGNCCLAYGVEANFAVALADPVGPLEEIEGVVRQFMAICQDNDWGLALYQTLPDFLAIYLRRGLKKMKIGDDAIVDLSSFNLEGKDMKKFRHQVNRMEKSGIRMVRYEPPITDEVLAQVRAVSNEWLQVPGRRERGFTLGKFEREYVRSTPLVAAVGQKGEIQAFVNLIPSYCKGEATIDLMRHRTDAPNGIMDYLFAKLFLSLRENGFERFNLGMAPMAGFQEKEEASLEEKAVHYFFQHLNFHFSYSGLRQFKAKFASFWEPRYVVYRHARDLPKLAIALIRLSELKIENE
jgi:phosphatidylglycerol lysyltransferase